jgi:ATP-dependent RNA helicase HelY
VVFDEIHFLDEPERGTVWEEALIYLPHGVRVVGLSATLSNLESFRAWLCEVRGEDVALVRETERAVPLAIQLVNRDTPPTDPDDFVRQVRELERAEGGGPRRGRRRRGRRRGRPANPRPERGRQNPTRHDEVVRQLEPDLLPCLYFLTSRRSCEVFGRQLSRRHPGFLDPAQREQMDGELTRFDDAHPRILGGGLGAMLIKGIAVHHAGLHVHLKGLVERLYEGRLIHVLYCTSTFALGINMPARTVVFQELQRFNGREMVPLGVREFQQMAGRAGRRGIDTVGHAVVRMDYADYTRLAATVTRLVGGEPEPVRSSFNLSLNSVVHLNQRFETDELRALLERSFLSFSVRRRRHKRGRARGGSGRDPVWSAFERKLRLLQQIGYLDDDGSALAGAKILEGIQIEEIFTTELVLEGVLDHLTPPQLFGALCALSTDITRAARASRPRGELATVAKALRKIRLSRVVRDAATEQGQQVTFCPEMIPIGVAWFEGKSLVELADGLDASADCTGLLVNGFRRAKDLASQLRRVYERGEDELMVDRLRQVMATVSRDEVQVVG